MLAACGWSSATEAPVKSNGALPVIAAPRSLAPDGSHFLSASGTPVLWLADTWWFCPSTLCPIDGSSNAAIPSMFKALVDQRAKQGFNVIQVAFQGPAAPGLGGVGGLYARQGNEQDRARVWQSARQYVQYANSRGLAVAIAASFHSGLDGLSLQQLQALWKDLVEALGEFEVIWLIAGEYNLIPPEGRMAKVDALAYYIRSIDQHQRLLTVHPADWTRNAPTLVQASWMDFTMVQAGHGALPPAAVYQPLQRRGNTVPVEESECRYEGIYGRVTAAQVRHCMVRSIQAGAIGFSYGAHGLWYPTQGTTDATFAEYGVARPWWEAVNYPGAAALARVRGFFERQRWWTMAARPDAVVTGERIPDEQRPLARLQADERALIWFPAGVSSEVPYSLKGLTVGVVYAAQWINGELGDADQPLQTEAITAQARLTALPSRPSAGEWFLRIERMATDPAGRPDQNNRN